jgi:hypothetical protein
LPNPLFSGVFVATFFEIRRFGSKKYYPLSLNWLARCRAEFWYDDPAERNFIDTVREFLEENAGYAKENMEALSGPALN